MIDIEIQDERGRPEARFEDPAIVSVLLEMASPETKCLQFIDTYGDTTFNPHQATVLVGELERVAAELPNELRERAERLISFVGRAAEAPHT